MCRRSSSKDTVSQAHGLTRSASRVAHAPMSHGSYQPGPSASGWPGCLTVGVAAAACAGRPTAAGDGQRACAGARASSRLGRRSETGGCWAEPWHGSASVGGRAVVLHCCHVTITLRGCRPLARVKANTGEHDRLGLTRSRGARHGCRLSLGRLQSEEGGRVYWCVRRRDEGG